MLFLVVELLIYGLFESDFEMVKITFSCSISLCNMLLIFKIKFDRMKTLKSVKSDIKLILSN